MATDKSEWKRGMPPGKYYEGMTDDFEVYFSPGGVKWHRRRSADEREQYRARCATIAKAKAEAQTSGGGGG